MSRAGENARLAALHLEEARRLTAKISQALRGEKGPLPAGRAREIVTELCLAVNAVESHIFRQEAPAPEAPEAESPLGPDHPAPRKDAAPGP